MQWMSHIASVWEALLATVYAWIITVLVGLDDWMHAQLAFLNTTPNVETAALLFLLVIIGFIFTRAFGGVVRIGLLLFVVGLILDVLVPALNR